MGKGIQEKEVGKNASMKNLGPCHRIKRGVCTKKEKGVLIVKGGKGESTGIHGRSVEERIHLTFQVAPNVTSTLHSKEGWHTENGTGLLTYKSMDNKE